jgi:putative endonuclease
MDACLKLNHQDKEYESFSLHPLRSLEQYIASMSNAVNPAAKHLQTGKEGESLACGFLLEKGYSILKRNWRWKRYEIDIICEKEGILHFVEVKTRTSVGFGLPEKAVDFKKLQRIQKAACAYLKINHQETDFQLDVIAILELPGKKPALEFLQDLSL